jgi:hypothetical protein
MCLHTDLPLPDRGPWRLAYLTVALRSKY